MITDDGAIDSRKKPKRKKKILKNPVVTLIDAFAHVSPDRPVSAKAYSNYSTTADSELSDEEYGVRKKKKIKKNTRKAKKPRKPKALIAEQENVTSTNVSIADTSSVGESPLESSFLPISDDSGVAGIDSTNTSIVSGFYQKCRQISTTLTSSDDDLAAQSGKDSSHVMGGSLAKGREKKNKHKETCHKNKKFRPHTSKLRELLTQPTVLDETNNLSMYNNSINGNDIYQVNSINDMFMSSISAPEYEVELETTPLESLSKHDQISVTKVSACQSPLRNVPQPTTSPKPNVTVEIVPPVCSQLTVKNEKPVPVTTYQLVRMSKNYLMSVVPPTELASPSVQVPAAKNSFASISMVPSLLSSKKSASTSSFISAKPKTEVPPVIIKPLHAGNSSTLVKPKNCK